MSEAPDIGTIIEALEQYTSGDTHQRAIDAAIDVLRAVEPRESALIAERDALRASGEMLACCAYNLAQRAGETLSTHDAEALDKCRRKWDATLSAPAVEGV